MSQFTAETLLAHPRFAAAARLHVQTALTACDGDPLVTAIYRSPARHIAFFAIACFSAMSEWDERLPPLTLTILLKAMKPWGLASHGVVENLIHRLVDRDLLTRERHPDDRRMVVLKPNAAFMDLFARISAPHRIPVAILSDDAFVARVAAGEPEAMQLYRAYSVIGHNINGATMLQRTPRLLGFISFEAGWLILFALLDAIWRGDGSARTPTALARRFGVSRPHVSKVLTVAAEAGLLEASTQGLFEPTAQFRGDIDVWVADCLATYTNVCIDAGENAVLPEAARAYSLA